MTSDMSKFKKIINKLNKMGVNFYQAGTTSKYHEMNFIVENKEQDRLYWICKSFGKFYVSYKNGIHTNSKEYRFECSSQQAVCDIFSELMAQNDLLSISLKK